MMIDVSVAMRKDTFEEIVHTQEGDLQVLLIPLTKDETSVLVINLHIDDVKIVLLVL
jgi:ribosomal protein L25 (general stress protein Ctc)